MWWSRIFRMPFPPCLQEDAEALWRDGGQASSGADPLWAASGEGCDRAPVPASWGETLSEAEPGTVTFIHIQPSTVSFLLPSHWPCHPPGCIMTTPWSRFPSMVEELSASFHPPLSSLFTFEWINIQSQADSPLSLTQVSAHHPGPSQHPVPAHLCLQ